MKKTTIIAAALAFAAASAQAETQTILVQGVPREVPMCAVAQSATDDVCDVDFSKIERWIGEGVNEAALAIKFNDEKAPKILVWGYRWADGTTATGETMLRDVAKGDPGFYALIYGDTQYGTAIGGMGYDLDGDGFTLLFKGEEQTAADNVYYTSAYNFDDYAPGDADDVWFSGWYNGYLSYWVVDKTGESYGYSGVGATQRELTNGCVDGWAACRDMSDWNSANMIGELEYLPALGGGYSGYNMPQFGNKEVITVSGEMMFYDMNGTADLAGGSAENSFSMVTFVPANKDEVVKITFKSVDLVTWQPDRDPDAASYVAALKVYNGVLDSSFCEFWPTQTNNVYGSSSGLKFPNNDQHLKTLTGTLENEAFVSTSADGALTVGCHLREHEPCAGWVAVVTTEPAKKSDSGYTNGVFIVNEDWYGHNNSTINYLDADGVWTYRVVQTENPGIELGATADFGTIYGGKFYAMCKQDQDPGAAIRGARLTVLDAETMKVEKQIPIIIADAKGNSVADGRGFLGVDENKGYIGTSNGIYPINLNTYEIGSAVEGSAGAEGDYYSSQIGMMLRVNDRVFAAHQKKGLLVINPETDKVENTIAGIDGWIYGSVVLSKDGNLWLSLADALGNADKRIVKLDPATLETTIVELPEGIHGPANSWFAWTPDCFCSSTQENVLYWNGGESSWFSGEKVYKYDIDKNEFSTYIDLAAEGLGWQIYGCSFRINPVTNNAFVSLFKNYGDTSYVLREYDPAGNIVNEYSMIENYWFPGVPVFPDNAAPEVAVLEDVMFSSKELQTISLDEVATDADNMAVAMVKTIKEIGDTSVLTAEMLNGDLVITPLAQGETSITIQVNSNGKLAEAVVYVAVSDLSGVENIECNAVEVARYSLDGKLLSAPQCGVNIVRMSDGSVKKVVVK